MFFIFSKYVLQRAFFITIMNRLIIVENYLCYWEKYVSNRVGETGIGECGIGGISKQRVSKQRVPKERVSKQRV